MEGIVLGTESARLCVASLGSDAPRSSFGCDIV